VDLTSSVKAALLLSQSIYWTRHGRDIARNGGWFHKTTEQWAIETGLSPKEQASAREVLRNLALLDDQRIGIPARLHFRLRLDELGARLADRIAGHPQAVDWSDRLVLAELLGPSVAFHRTLVEVAGGVHGGLMLSRALHLTRLQVDVVWTSGSSARPRAGSRSSVSRGANRKRRGAISCVPGSGRSACAAFRRAWWRASGSTAC
jgi:hypothetical protein